MSVCEFTTYVTDADGEEREVRAEVTEYQPGTPEWKVPRMEKPTPDMIRAARVAAGLTQGEAAAVVHRPSYR
ncbi:hypothetical protein, partial [Escherichia coli]|uniref:hypothetical protein n=1 Tax=Escherichia coli TaxID=562 RepID=UPI0019D5BFAF